MPGAKRTYNEAGPLRALGSTVRNLRLAAGLSQYQLAEQASLARTYLAEIETGTRNPSLLILVRLADALDVRVQDLVADI